MSVHTQSCAAVPVPLINGAQCRAARSLLGWTQHEVARLAGLSKTAIVQFETGSTDSRGDTRSQIAAVFVRHGLEFMPPSGVNRRVMACKIFADPATLAEEWPSFLRGLIDAGGRHLTLHNWPDFAAEFTACTGMHPDIDMQRDDLPDRAATIGEWMIVPILNGPCRIAFSRPAAGDLSAAMPSRALLEA